MGQYLFWWVVGMALCCAVGAIATKNREERKVWFLAGLLLGILGIPAAFILTALDVDGNDKQN